MLNAAEMSGFLGRIVTGSLEMPAAVRVPVTAGTVEAWTLVAFLSGALVALGVFTQGACLLAAASFLFAMLWDEQAYTNHFWLTTLLVTYLAFARSDAQWSLRAAARGRLALGSPVPAFLMVTQLSVCYLYAGLSKLNPWWIAGDELRWSLRFEVPGALYTPLAFLVVCSELFLATAIWFIHTRRVALLLGIMLHVSIVVLMRDPLPLFTFSVVCLSLYPLVASAPYARDLVAGSRRTTREPASKVWTVL